MHVKKNKSTGSILSTKYNRVKYKIHSSIVFPFQTPFQQIVKFYYYRMCEWIMTANNIISTRQTKGEDPMIKLAWQLLLLKFSALLKFTVT